MEITTRKTAGQYDGREVPYVELEVLGGKHTLSVRKYPKNVSVQMWENSDKSGTKVILKLPHDKFDFTVHVSEIVGNFDTDLDLDTLILFELRWTRAAESNSF